MTRKSFNEKKEVEVENYEETKISLKAKNLNDALLKEKCHLVYVEKKNHRNVFLEESLYCNKV